MQPYEILFRCGFFRARVQNRKTGMNMNRMLFFFLVGIVFRLIVKIII